MGYFGGKTKIAKELSKVLESFREPNQEFYEPFVGGCSITCQMSGIRFGFDKHQPLIEMWKALQKGWFPPNEVSVVEYHEAKNGQYPLPLTGFIGFGCSFAGKYFGGYAKNKRGDKICLHSKNSFIKRVETMSDVVFECAEYQTLKPVGKLIYCDPPYNGTTGYSLGKFNSEEFWNIMREWSKNNIVLISEYSAPKDFECVWQKKTKTEIRTKNNGREDRIEKLFKYSK